ncbi:MAG: hypothetical protein IJW06_00325 [Clostridia bacterium]|nr:hypothetical protein [Clostridia bacterium]
MYSMRRFGPDSETLNQLSSSKTKQIISIVIGIVLFVVAMFLGNVQSDRWYDPDAYELLNMLKILCIIIGIIEVICSAIIYYVSAKSYDMLVRCHVTLYDDRIEGEVVKDDYSSSFILAWEDIICAYCDVSGLTIKTITGLKVCPNIENTAMLAKIINDKIAEFTESYDDCQIEEVTENEEVKLPKDVVERIVESTEEAPEEMNYDSVNFDKNDENINTQDFKFCIFCGQKLPPSAAFCCSCGEKQDVQ